MITHKGYTIVQNPDKNIITICMPQRIDTAQTTALPVNFERKYSLTSDELLMVLKMIIGLFE